MKIDRYLSYKNSEVEWLGVGCTSSMVYCLNKEILESVVA
jgi:hypothetical protein